MTASQTVAKKENTQIYLRNNWHSLAWGTAMALVLNLALFSLIPVLLEPSSDEVIYEQVIPQVNVIRLKRDETEVKRKRLKPPEEQKKQKPKMKQDKASPVITKLVIPFEINPRLPSGPNSLELPPMETIPFDMNAVKDTFEIGQLDEPLTQLVKIPPVYPSRAKRRGVRGLVNIEFVVNKQGTVKSISILDSDPPGVFDQAVINSISKWRFKPGKIAGIPVNTRVTMPIRFSD